VANSKEDLLTKVEALRNVMVSRAIGGDPSDADYVKLRRELLAVPELKDRLPRCVRACYALSDFWGFIQPQFARYAERQAYLRSEFAPALDFLEARRESPCDESIATSLKAFGLAEVSAAWAKALERRERDPEGAITAARTLLETTCKAILDQQAAAYDHEADLPKLYAATATTLNLAPDQHHEEVFKRILGGCQSVVNGLGTLRNKLSDAHGKSAGQSRPAARHAALAVNLAGSMATFLVESFAARRGSTPLGDG